MKKISLFISIMFFGIGFSTNINQMNIFGLSLTPSNVFASNQNCLPDGSNSATCIPSGSPAATSPSQAFTADNDNILGKSSTDLRTGNITMADIPMMIASAIEYILAITGTICVVALIYHAVRMQFASGITGDSSGVDKAKKGIYGSLLGFVLAMSAWFLMSKLVALLASTTSGS